MSKKDTNYEIEDCDLVDEVESFEDDLDVSDLIEDEEIIKKTDMAISYFDRENKVFFKNIHKVLEGKIFNAKYDKIVLIKILEIYFEDRGPVNTSDLAEDLKIKPGEYKKLFSSIQHLRLEKYIELPDNINMSDDNVHSFILPDKELLQKITNTSLVRQEKEPPSPFEEFTFFMQNFSMGYVEEPVFYPTLKKHIKSLLKSDNKYKVLFKYATTDIEKAMVSFTIMQTINKEKPMGIFEFSEMLHLSYVKSMDAVNILTDRELDIVKNKTIYFSKDEENNDQLFNLNSNLIETVFGRAFVLNDNKEFKTLRKAKLTKRNLFFPDEINTQINTIKKALDDKSFKEIQNNLSEIGLNSGLTLLFHGLPGTGKTALAEELGILTNRDVYYVDISSIRGKYVGESEKNSAAIFEEYEKACEMSELTLYYYLMKLTQL